MKDSKVFLIDTNSLLHYHLFTEINWCDELNSENIILLIPPTVLKELDQKKFSESDIDLRNRARKVLSKLSENINENNVKNLASKIQLIFIVGEPKIDWEKQNLDPLIPDDRIIATALEFISQYGKSVTIITSDIGLSLKSRNKEMETHKLSDSLLLEPKKTGEEKEILKLKSKLAIYENRLPKLALRFITEDNTTKLLSKDIKPIEEYSIDQTKNIIKTINDKLEYHPKKIDTSNINEMFKFHFGIPIADETKRYENDVSKYLKDLEVFYKNEWNYREIISRIIKIKFVLINEGTTPADDIDIFIHFPDGFEMFDSKKYPEKPEQPKEPSPPRSMAEIMKSTMDLGIQASLFNSYSRINTNPLPNKPDYSPRIKKTNSYDISYKIEKLKHGMSRNLDPVFILFDTVQNAKSFSIDYKIITGNHPEYFTDKLNIKINKEIG